MDSAAALPDQLVRTSLFSRGVPERFTIVDGGATVLFLRGRGGDDPDSCLWALDVQTGQERLVADRADAYATDDSGALIAFTTAGQLWTVRQGSEPRRVPVDGPVSDPRPDPAGVRIAYVRDGALRVVDDDGSDRELAVPDGPDVTYGIGEHTDGGRGFWWAPDGRALLVARVDASRVERWQVADPSDPTRAPRAIRYAAVGTPNVDASLWIVGLDGSRAEVRWDRAAYEYLPGAGWDADGPYALVQSRDQRTVRYLAIGPTGDTIVLTEWTDPCWAQVVPGLPALTASGSLVAHADVGDTRYLTIDGRPVTPPGLQVRSVLGVDGEEVLFTASGEPTETHLWTYDGRLVRLTEGAGVHTGIRRHGTSVTATRDLTGGRILVRSKGNPDRVIRSLGEQPVLAVRRIRLDLGELGLRAALHLPSWHRPGTRLPVLLDPYGGGAMQRVTAELTWRVLVSQWFAEQGFAVLVADGRGTPGRGPAWERAVHGDLYRLVLDDQLTALAEAARRQPDLDLDRVGIRGWSFSGGLAIRAVLRHPDVFHAAVAGAGVTDQRLYNAYWRERFLGHPDDFPERYEECSLIREAARLTRPLLLMHGMLDTNVHVVNTLRFADALSRAGRDHQLMLIPGAGHRPFAEPAAGDVLRRQAGFLRDALTAS